MKMESAIDTVPQIAAERFVLRSVRHSDAGLLAMHAGDRRVAWMTSSVPHPLPPGATDAFIARANAAERTEDIWVLDGSDHGMPEVLGVISLKRMDRGQSEIGYWVAPAWWNTGIASEAVRALLAANPTDDRTIFATVFQDNPFSAQILTTAGFEYLGDAETFSLARGARVPTWTYLRKMV